MKLGKKDTSPFIKNSTSVNKSSTKKKNLFACKGQGHPMLKFKKCVKNCVFSHVLEQYLDERTQESN